MADPAKFLAAPGRGVVAGSKSARSAAVTGGPPALRAFFGEPE